VFAQLGSTELLIILAVVILIFGVGRIGRLGGELGSGIRAFRKGIQEPEDGETLNDQQSEA
jgi:sec-independent protein translocase protein TatA